ncbi:MAG TPA: MFS transporter [Actinomycetota bacterium]|nr:MFS transporter [Actinomycetota bacterium]
MAAEKATDDVPDTGATAAWSLLRRNRDFRRLYLASVISLGGDWFLFVALTSLVIEATDRALFVGLLVLAQELAFVVSSPFAGVLADRLDRRKLMIACDVGRAAICVSFLAVGEATIWLAYPLIALLAIFAAPFDPASSASIPNLVDRTDLPVANALAGSLWGTMLAVGAALGGVAAGALGHDAAFLIDAGSFVGSAVLLLGIRRPFSELGGHEPGHDGVEHPSILEATVETARYARRDHRVLALLAVKGGFGLAAGVLALIPVFAELVFDAGEVGLGLMMACRGLGALIGPFLGHRLAGPDHERIFAAILGSLVVFGFGYIAMGAAPGIGFAAMAILVAHLGGGSQWVLSTYGLQVLVPDRIRGRIFGFDFAFIGLSLGLSSLAASWAADRFGPRPAAYALGVIALAWAGVWWVATRRVRRATTFADRGVVAEPSLAPVPPGVD